MPISSGRVCDSLACLVSAHLYRYTILLNNRDQEEPGQAPGVTSVPPCINQAFLVPIWRQIPDALHLTERAIETLLSRVFELVTHAEDNLVRVRFSFAVTVPKPESFADGHHWHVMMLKQTE